MQRRIPPPHEDLRVGVGLLVEEAIREEHAFGACHTPMSDSSRNTRSGTASPLRADQNRRSSPARRCILPTAGTTGKRPRPRLMVASRWAAARRPWQRLVLEPRRRPASRSPRRSRREADPATRASCARRADRRPTRARSRSSRDRRRAGSRARREARDRSSPRARLVSARGARASTSAWPAAAGAARCGTRRDLAEDHGSSARATSRLKAAYGDGRGRPRGGGPAAS